MEEAVKRHKHGVLQIHDLQKTLKGKGIDFPNRVLIFEVCSPQRAEQVLRVDMRVNLALPCRISVFEENGEVKMGMIKPTFLLSSLIGKDEMRSRSRRTGHDEDD